MGAKRPYRYTYRYTFRSPYRLPKTLEAMIKTRRIFGISLSILLINLAAIMERADENLLPSVYKEVSEAFGAGPVQLGYLTFARNFVRGAASPLAGVLVLRHDRPAVLAAGTLCWALSTAAMAASGRLAQAFFWRAVNGLGLAIVIPALQSFVADSYGDGARGVGFGAMSFVGAFGGIGGGVVATVMAGHDFLGVPGWRVAFVMMAGLSAGIGALVYLFVVDPRDTDRKSAEREGLIGGGESMASVWAESWAAMKLIAKVKTFQIIVLQGVVGSLPWTAMVFFTMWFELIGFDHNHTATLLSLFAIGCALGALVGGFVADRLSRMHPRSGRVACAQFSAGMGIPFSLLLLRIIPQSVGSYHAFCVTLFFMGLTISWCGAAVNAPIFAEVVPARHRTMIYAFDRAFEGSISAFAAPLVGILSEHVFGYNPKGVDPVLGSGREALALSRGLLTMMTVPFGLCCLFYTPLHWTFWRDRESVRMAVLKEEEMM